MVSPFLSVARTRSLPSLSVMRMPYLFCRWQAAKTPREKPQKPTPVPPFFYSKDAPPKISRFSVYHLYIGLSIFRRLTNREFTLNFCDAHTTINSGPDFFPGPL
jgi:hypothetical protein